MLASNYIDGRLGTLMLAVHVLAMTENSFEG